MLKVPTLKSNISFDTPNRESFSHDVDKDKTSFLGRGAYGVVFRAVYKSQEVAVKILAKSNDSKYKSLRQEANILNLHHENIIKILKIVDCSTYGALIMERYEGNHLQHVLDNNQVDLIHRLFILSDITNALAFCHENKIIHSDLKPQNILVAVNSTATINRNYICKLFDFGCSIRMNLKHGDENFCGTVRYCAPEILQNLEPDCSADIFSLAIIMWQLKENKIPYGFLTNETIIWNVVRNHMRPDSLKVTLLNDDSKISKRSPHEICQFSKSESSFLHIKKFFSLPLTPKSFNRNVERRIPEILINKPLRFLEKSSYGSHQKNRIFKHHKQQTIRKKLFESKLSPKFEVDELSGAEELFVDPQLSTRSAEAILLAESEYVKLYKECWNCDKNRRHEAVAVREILQNLIKSL